MLSLALFATAGRVLAAETAALSNLSVRTTMAAGQTLIVGGVVSGGAKNILVRAGGPALNKFGLSGMADPRLALFTSGSTPVASNDNWAATLAPTFTAVGAFGFDAGSRDAALAQSFNGSFTVQATGDAAGTILVEAYDVAGGYAARMINVSARNRVGTGNDVLIAGFNISGTGTKTLLIRGVGPGLAAFGVPGTLADPLLRLFDGTGAVIATNDDWDAALASTMSSVGGFALPANSKDAAMTVRLTPGSYSVQVSGADGGTGDGIVEIYEIEDPLSEARLPGRATGVSLGFPKVAASVPSVGNVSLKVLFAEYPDAVATRTPQSIMAMLSPNVENLFRATSYGRLNLTLDTVPRWLRTTKTSAQYSWTGLTAAQHRATIQDIVDLAVASGASFADSDAVLVIFNPDGPSPAGAAAFVAGETLPIVAGGKVLRRAVTFGRSLLTWGYKNLNHEIGHILGLVDLYDVTTSTAIHRFVGDFSLMGLISGTAPEYFGWERWILGWLDDAQVTCAKSGTATFVLTPLESSGGNKLVVVPTGATSAVVVEYRRPLGFDSALAKSGPLVYFIDTSIASGNGVIKVLPLDDANLTKRNHPLSDGQAVTHSGVTVRCVSADANSATVEVTRP